MPEKLPEERPKSERRVRRPTPLGLMGPPAGMEPPKASGLPSLRATGIMVAFMAAALLLWACLWPPRVDPRSILFGGG